MVETLIALEEALARAEESSVEFLTAEDLYQLQEHRAEAEAENAWLRAAESAGWEEAYLESLLESGLISNY